MVQYSEGVLVGDWNEKLQAKQAVLNNYIQNKKTNQLLSQKSAIVKQNLLQEISISVQPDGVVRYGDKVQVVNPEFKTALSNVISHRDVSTVQDLNGKCFLSGSSDLTPNVRNVFRVMSVNPINDQQHKPLRYGEDFYLMTTQRDKDPLYVESEVPNMNSTMGLSKHPRVTLSEQRNSHCRWNILSFHKVERKDMVNCPVRSNVPVRINHSASNQQLALELLQFFTVFGTEHEVSVHTYMDIHKNEKLENSWIFSVPESKQEDLKIKKLDEELPSVDALQSEEIV